MSDRLTCVRGCNSKGRHLDECTEDDCWGCLPRLVATGLQVCTRCEWLTRTWIKELPELYLDLLIPSRTTSALSERVDAEISTPALIGDRSKIERDSIRACLVTWMFILMEDREMSAPEDTIEAMAARLGIHAGWLLAESEHADQLVHDLDAAVTTARRVAYPSRPDSHPLGNCPVEDDDGVRCGEMVRARPSDEFATCRKCGTEAVIAWWQSAIHADEQEIDLLTGTQAASMLSWRYQRIITEAVVRQWASRELKPRPGQSRSDVPPILARQGKDERGRTLYALSDLLRHAAFLYERVAA